MERFRQKYLEEAQDLLQELEQALLVLERHPSDRESAEKVFRVMHTLKGSSSMFGYPKVSEITHFLESSFNDIRVGEAPLNKDLASLTFRSLDHIKQLLKDQHLKGEATRQEHDFLVQQLTSVHEQGSQTEILQDNTLVVGTCATYLIYFKPQKEALRFGANPLYILDDLAQLGHLISFVSGAELPVLSELDPQAFYLKWGCLLATEASLQEIQDVFLFVEDLSEFKIIRLSDQHLLESADQALLTAFADRFQQGVPEEDIQLFAEELSSTLSGKQEKNEPKTSRAGIRVSSEKLDEFINLISELVTSQAHLSLLADRYAIPELQEASEHMEKITRQIRDKSLEISLVPISSTLTLFRRLVRDLAQELNKKIIFEVEGEDTELDKNVIEHLSDCLVHIFRNSIDHGIEDEVSRIRSGKSPEGRILLKAYTTGGKVVIEVQDDGAGIDTEKVLARARQKGLVPTDAVLSPEEVFELLFHPGFSMAQNVTAVSGRGIGMDVVMKKIKELKGDIKLASRLQKGTRVTLSIPLSLSIIEGLMVRVAGHDYVMPLSFVEKSYSISRDQVEKSSNRQLMLGGRPLPYFSLSEEFNGQALPREGFALTIRHEGKVIALLVDEIIGEYQGVLKPIGAFFLEQAFISGASLKGDGTVALVLDPQQLVQKLHKQHELI